MVGCIAWLDAGLVSSTAYQLLHHLKEYHTDERIKNSGKNETKNDTDDASLNPNPDKGNQDTEGKCSVQHRVREQCSCGLVLWPAAHDSYSMSRALAAQPAQNTQND